MVVQSTFKNMVLCLLAVCLVCSGLLAGVYALTKEGIDQAQAKKTSDAVRKVLPFKDNSVMSEEKSIEFDGRTCKYYEVATEGDSVTTVDYAIIATSSGFGGALTVMVGITSDGVIYNTSVLAHAETPGLGAKCTEPAFADQFRGFDPEIKVLSVTKDKGDVNAITASTITSRAYCKALENAVAIFKKITETDGQTCCPCCEDSCCGEENTCGEQACPCCDGECPEAGAAPEADEEPLNE